MFGDSPTLALSSLEAGTLLFVVPDPTLRRAPEISKEENTAPVHPREKD
jgi:hypothetical protein